MRTHKKIYLCIFKGVVISSYDSFVTHMLRLDKLRDPRISKALSKPRFVTKPKVLRMQYIEREK